MCVFPEAFKCYGAGIVLNWIQIFESMTLTKSNPEQRIQLLLMSMTLDQIRSAASRLVPNKRVTIRTHKDAYSGILSTAKSVQDICNALLEVESATPAKHLVLSKISSARLAEQVNLVVDTSGQSLGFGLHIVYVHQAEGLISITLEHSVRVLEWQETKPGVKTKIETTVRHPLVVKLFPSEGYSSISYPGFSQGSGTPRASLISYEELVNDACAFVGKKYSVTFSTLAAQKSIGVLLEGGNSKIKVVRSDLDSLFGRISLTSANQKQSVEQLLASFLGDDLPVEVKELVLDRSRKAIGANLASFLILYWFEEDVYTRVKFWDIGTELLFVWHGTSPSLRLVDSILGVLRSTAVALTEQNPKHGGTPIQYISKAQPGTLMRIVDIAEMFGLEPNAAKGQVMTALRIGLIQPVYRLGTTALIADYTNDWTTDPSALNRNFETEEGYIIEGTDPRTIEVAFQRVDAGGQQ
jgi:hypothetical protein